MSRVAPAESVAEGSAAPSSAPHGATPAQSWREPLLTLAIAFGAFLVGLLLFNSVIMPRFVHREGEVVVPDLARLPYERAERLADRDGLHLSRAGERFDTEVPRGGILSQEPLAGTRVRNGARVSVTLSLGQESSDVPVLTGQTRRSAQLLLERAGLAFGGVTRVASETVAEDMVLASDPPAGTLLPRGSVVTLLVSSGPDAEVFVMPDVVGQEVARVRQRFEAQGLTVVAPSVAGPVVAQDPPAGAPLRRDMPITLRVGGRVLR